MKYLYTALYCFFLGLQIFTNDATCGFLAVASLISAFFEAYKESDKINYRLHKMNTLQIKKNENQLEILKELVRVQSDKEMK